MYTPKGTFPSPLFNFIMNSLLSSSYLVNSRGTVMVLLWYYWTPRCDALRLLSGRANAGWYIYFQEGQTVKGRWFHRWRIRRRDMIHNSCFHEPMLWMNTLIPLHRCPCTNVLNPLPFSKLPVTHNLEEKRDEKKTVFDSSFLSAWSCTHSNIIGRSKEWKLIESFDLF